MIVQWVLFSYNFRKGPANLGFMFTMSTVIGGNSLLMVPEIKKPLIVKQFNPLQGHWGYGLATHSEKALL